MQTIKHELTGLLQRLLDSCATRLVMAAPTKLLSNYRNIQPWNRAKTDLDRAIMRSLTAHGLAPQQSVTGS